MGRQCMCLLILFTFRLHGEDAVRTNLVARLRATHQTVTIQQKDIQIYFDGERQPISTFEPLGCQENSPGTVAVILSSTEIGQTIMSSGGSGFTEIGARQAEARKVLDQIPRELTVEAYGWAPRLIPIRTLEQDGSMEVSSLTDALRIFDRSYRSQHRRDCRPKSLRVLGPLKRHGNAG